MFDSRLYNMKNLKLTSLFLPHPASITFSLTEKWIIWYGNISEIFACADRHLWLEIVLRV
jgi:hypothetical protein